MADKKTIGPAERMRGLEIVAKLLDAKQDLIPIIRAETNTKMKTTEEMAESVAVFTEAILQYIYNS